MGKALVDVVSAVAEWPAVSRGIRFATIALEDGGVDQRGGMGPMLALGASGLYPSDEWAAFGVVVTTPCLDDDLWPVKLWKFSPFTSSSRGFELKLAQ